MIQKRSTYPLLACLAAIITAWAAGASVAAQADAPARPDLTGKWQLNRDLSDDAQEKLQSMGGGHASRGGGHGPGRHGGFGGIGSGGRAGSEDMHAELGEVILNAPTSFVLTQDDQKVVLAEPDGRVRTLPTNNRKVKVDGRDVQTKWENDRLVSEITVGNATVIETYERSPTDPQLIVTAKMDMRGRHVSVRRVYDAVAE